MVLLHNASIATLVTSDLKKHIMDSDVLSTGMIENMIENGSTLVICSKMISDVLSTVLIEICIGNM